MSKTSGVHASFGSWHLTAITADESAFEEAAQALLIASHEFAP